ncbi:hypothetical protein PIB30_003491 [Stylosanthes scabra]|uniref:BURP domain-containing protein n=1 Tax=Stylosanthes scabra TaxID=79078 RepID=A0ABU6V359_9FABA|nr:hypothetical protein [Stylosanthes scabra]
MEFNHLLPLSVALVCLALLGSHVQASLPAEDYWQTLWPNTPMPKAFKDLLVQPGELDEYCELLDNKEKWTLVQQQATRSSKTKVSNGAFFLYLYDNPASVIDTSSPFSNYFPFWAYGKKSDNSIDNPTSILRGYGKKSDNSKISENSIDKIIRLNGTFFFEHDLLPGKKVMLKSINPSDEFSFLPDKIAKTVPFSSNRLQEILKRLNIEADSTDAKSMKKTLTYCENSATRGEDKYCATSLESLLDFAVSKLGKNIRLFSTEFERKAQDWQSSVAVEGAKKIGEKTMLCHKMNYPYAVFLCHKIDTRTYSVPLVASNDGTNVKALAVCHTDTSEWAPNHVAFKMLNTKPGKDPICHFLPTDTVIWVQQFSTLKDDM